MEQGTSKLDMLREDILAGKLNRRSVLKRAMVMGLSAPVIASLLAACGSDDEDEGEGSETEPTAAGQGGAQTSPTAAGGAEPTEADGEAEETEETETEASPATGGSQGSTGETPGQGRGVAELLRILYWQAPTILNPHFSQGTKDSAAASLVLEPLIDVDIEGNLVPVLAAEIPTLENGGLSEDGLTVTYTLKEGVTWSDGEPFTAEDVVFTWQYVTDEATSATTIATYTPLESVEAVDDTTVTLTFKEPAPGWYSPFATGFGGHVLPKHILEGSIGAAARDAEFNLNPIGTGPYKVQEFRPGDVIIFEMNENYREADKPYFQTVEFKGGGDASAAARAALETGETDWAWNLQVERSVLEPMAEGSEIGTLQITPASSIERVLINFADPNTEVDGARSEPTTEHPFLTDLAVRQALNMASDRDTVAEQLYGPAGQATANILVAPEKFASPNTSYSFDTDAAAQMLEDAGWTGSPRSKDGVEMSILYQTTINPLRQKTQEVLKQGWESIGVPTELKSIDAGVYFSSDAGNPDTASHFYADVEMYTNGNTNPYPIDYMAGWKSVDPAVDIAQKSNQWAGANVHRWVNEEYNELYTQALTELDEDAQIELFHQMNDILIENVVVIPLVHRADVVGVNTKLKGYSTSPWTPDVRDIANWYMEE